MAVRFTLVCLALAFSFLGCRFQNTEEKEDVILAKVYNKSLYLSDIDNMIHEGMTEQDSLRVIRAYIERWVRDQLLLQKAEQNIPRDLNVDKLVQEYRSSLILNNYERMLMQSQLDSTISERELIAFYEANKEQYILEKPIARLRFLKFRKDIPQLDQAIKWWNDPTGDNERKLHRFSDRHAVIQILQDTTWLNFDQVMQLFSSDIVNINNLSAGKSFQYADEDYVYLLHILEIRSTLEVAPLGYIREQATRAIMHQREIALLEKVKENLYALEIKKNNVKIYIQ